MSLFTKTHPFRPLTLFSFLSLCHRRRRRAFRRQAYAALSQTLLNLRPIVVHNEKEDGSRSLGRSSDTTYYDGSVRARRKRDSQIPGEREPRVPACIHGRGRSTLAKPESAIVRYEWLSRWTFPYPSRYILLATVAYQIFRCRARNSPSNIIVGCSTSRCRSVGPDLPTSSRQYIYVYPSSKTISSILCHSRIAWNHVVNMIIRRLDFPFFLLLFFCCCWFGLIW